MKKENRYTQAIEQIAPDENFVNDTVQKLAKSKPRRSFVQYALPALTILVVAFVAVIIF